MNKKDTYSIKMQLNSASRPAGAVCVIACAFCVVLSLLCGCRREKEVKVDDNIFDMPDTEVTETVVAEEPKMTEEDMKEIMEENPERFGNSILPIMLDDAPEYALRLMESEYPRFIVVDKSRMKVIVFDRDGHEEASYGMACGKNYGTKHKKADSRTPEGFFTVHKVYNSTEWLFTDDNGKTSDKKGQFGPRFIRLNIPGTTQIGIHGTCAPWSIGGRSSHGCIRITNENIMALVELVDSGMPVIVTPSLRDIKTNLSEGYHIAAISTVPGKHAIGVSRETIERNREAVASAEEEDVISSQDTVVEYDSESELKEQVIEDF